MINRQSNELPSFVKDAKNNNVLLNAEDYDLDRELFDGSIDVSFVKHDTTNSVQQNNRAVLNNTDYAVTKTDKQINGPEIITQQNDS